MVAHLLREGCTAKQIAAWLGEGVSRNAVIGIVHRRHELRSIGFKSQPGPPFPKRNAAPPPPKPAPIKAPQPGNLTLLELKATSCRWPVAERADVVGHFLFCGLPHDNISLYCPTHHKSAHQAHRWSIK
jgi:hypothetical protein